MPAAKPFRTAGRLPKRSRNRSASSCWRRRPSVRARRDERAMRSRSYLRMARFAAMMLRRGSRSSWTVADLFESQTAKRPDHVFVRFEGRSVTYGELDALANRIAHWALARGLGKGDAVAVLMENRPEFLAAWIGLAKVGATAA